MFERRCRATGSADVIVQKNTFVHLRTAELRRVTGESTLCAYACADIDIDIDIDIESIMEGMRNECGVCG